MPRMSNDQNPTVKAYSLICHCGHPYDDHHNSGIVEGIAGVCEFFGCNEEGGLDENGNIHCLRYIDTTQPDEQSLTQIILPSAAELVASQKRREEWVRRRQAEKDALVRKVEEHLTDASKPIEIDPDQR
jgi:hypothetical protein